MARYKSFSILCLLWHCYFGRIQNCFVEMPLTLDWSDCFLMIGFKLDILAGILNMKYCFLNFISNKLTCMFILMLYHTILITIALCSTTSNWVVQVFQLCYFFSFSFFNYYSEFLNFHMNFNISFSFLEPNKIGISIGVWLKLQVNVGSIAILTVLGLPIYEHKVSFPFIMEIFNFLQCFVILAGKPCTSFFERQKKSYYI